jgi:DNA-binding protein YbaB
MTDHGDPNGLGGFDLGAMLEQAQQMQAQLMSAQAELAHQTVDGTAGGVQVTLSGVGELTAGTVAVGSFDGADAESVADLGDLVVAAFRDAKSKADALASAALGPLASGFGPELGGTLGGDLGGPTGGSPLV